MDRETLRRLDQFKVVQRFPRGQCVYLEGGPALGMYCVRSGHIRLSKSASHMEGVVVGIAGPGATFGLGSLMASETNQITAQAIDDSTVCTITKSAIDQLMEDSRQLVADMLREVARELCATEARVAEMAQRSAPQRLAHTLLELDSETVRGDHGWTGRVRVPRTELARIAGTSPETVSRLLRRLADKKVVWLTRTEVELLDRRALRGMAEGRSR